VRAGGAVGCHAPPGAQWVAVHPQGRGGGSPDRRGRAGDAPGRGARDSRAPTDGGSPNRHGRADS
jgi:hypothetical protein